jgi:ubiquinone/menaquinone biosynthesis C-methylase UbiE
MPAAPPSLAPSARSGFADGASYDAHRPSYPSNSVNALVSALEVSPGAPVLDLGAGTGKFTTLLSAHPSHFRITAVEPHAGMRGQLAAKDLPRVVVKEGFATAIPLPDGAVEGVVVAQAFHWFCTREALGEIARVLKPSGVLALIWNIEDYNNTLSHPSPHSWTLAWRRHLFTLDTPDDSVRFRNEKWRAVFREADIPFSPLTEQTETWTRALGEEELWARLRTLSQIAAQKEGSEELAESRRVFEEAVRQEGAERDGEGRVIVRGETIVAWARRKS